MTSHTHTRSDLPLRMKFHASVRSVQWWAAAQEGRCHFASSPQCQLCAPASPRACLCPWEANPRCSPIRKPWLSNSSLPTLLPKSAHGGLQTTGSRSSPSGTWNHSQQSAKPFLNLQTSAHLWQHWRIQAKEKKSWPLSKLRGASDIDAESFSRDHERANRALKELKGEERRKSKPLFAK